MANLFNSAQSSFLSLRRDLEDVLDEMELPWRVRREMDRLFAESTSPMSLWRNVEYLLEDFSAPFVVRRRIESVFARFLSGRHVDSFNPLHTFNGMHQGSLFSNHGSPYGSQFMPLSALTQNPYTQFAHGSQFGQNPQFMQNTRWGSQWQNPYFTQSYGSQWQNPYFTQGYGSQWQNPYFTQTSQNYGSQFGLDPYVANTRFENTMFGQSPYFTQNYGTQFGVNPFTNTFATQSPLFGREYGAWTSPRNEWFASNRVGDGISSRWTRNAFNNVHAFNNPSNPMYGQYGNTVHGLNTFGGQAFNSQFGSQFNNQFGSQLNNQFGQFGQEFVPPVELIERDGEFVVRVELAGVREQDVEIRANEHILTIRGERRERFDNEVARHVGAYEYSERRYGTFTRTVTLPQGIDAAHIHAVFRDGVLELRIPQAETFRARRIPIGRIEEQRINGDQQGMHGRPHVS